MAPSYRIEDFKDWRKKRNVFMVDTIQRVEVSLHQVPLKYPLSDAKAVSYTHLTLPTKRIV